MNEHKEIADKKDYPNVRTTNRWKLGRYCFPNGYGGYVLQVIHSWILQNLSAEEMDEEAGRILEGLKNGTIRPEKDIEEYDEKDDDYSEEEEYNEEE